MSIVGEETGYTGMMTVIMVYLLLVGSAFMIAVLAPDRQGSLLAMGIGFSIGMHAFLNISVVSGFVPTTGVTAPLISYGGSSMMVTWICIGLLCSIVRRSREIEQKEYASLTNDPEILLSA